MIAQINIDGLGKAEAAAKEVLAHVDAIRQLLSRDLSPMGVIVTVDLVANDEKKPTAATDGFLF